MAVDWKLHYARGQQFTAWLGRFLTWALPRLAVIAPSLAAMIGVHNLLITTGSSETGALLGAISFELAYITLALVVFETAEELRTAKQIRWGAVGTSILFNVADQFFKLRPWWLKAVAAKDAEVHTIGLDIFLSFLHGLPLPLLGFLLSALLLHPPKGLSRAALQELVDQGKAKFDELQLRFDTLQNQFRVSQSAVTDLIPYRDSVTKAQELVEGYKLREAQLLEELRQKNAPAPVDKKVTPKVAVNLIKQNNLSLAQIVQAAIDTLGEAEAITLLKITKAQSRSLTKDS